MLPESTKYDDDNVHDRVTADSYCKLAISCYRSGKFDDARRFFSEAIQFQCENPALYLNRALALVELNRNVDAIHDLNASIQMNPNMSLFYQCRARVYHRMGYLELALNDLSCALTLDKHHTHSLAHRSHLLHEMGSHDLAICDINRAIELSPHLSELYLARGILYQKRGYSDLAIKSLSTGIEKLFDKNNNRLNKFEQVLCTAFMSRAFAFMKILKWEKAIQDFNQAIKMDANSAIALHGRGVCRMYLDRSLAAIRDFGRALDQSGQESVFRNIVLNDRSIVREKVRQFNDAISDITSTLETIGMTDNERKCSIVRRAYCYAQLQQNKKAICDYSEAIRIDCDDLAIRFNRGILLAKVGQFKQAVTDFSVVLEREPNNASALKYKSFCMEQKELIVTTTKQRRCSTGSFKKSSRTVLRFKL